MFGGGFEGNSTFGPLNGSVAEDQISFDGEGLGYESDSDIEDDDDAMINTLGTSVTTNKSSEKDASLKNDAGSEEVSMTVHK